MFSAGNLISITVFEPSSEMQAATPSNGLKIRQYSTVLMLVVTFCCCRCQEKKNLKPSLVIYISASELGLQRNKTAVSPGISN